MSHEHALDRTARLISIDLFAGNATADQIIDGLLRTTILVRADAANLASPNGQTALCALFSQVAMMGIGIDLDIPEVPMLIPQPPLRGALLKAALLDYGNDLIPSLRCGTGLPHHDLSFVLGDTATEDHHAVLVTGTDWSCAIGPASQIPPSRWDGKWPVGALAAAATAAPEALRAATRRIASSSGHHLSDEFHHTPGCIARIDLSDRAVTPAPINLGPVDIISGGAITYATTYTLLRAPELSARIRVIDPQTLELTNLNRYPLLRYSDLGQLKTTLLEQFSQGSLQILGVPETFDDSWPASLGPLAPRVLIGADHIPARWQAQRAQPQWLQVSGTSHLFAISSAHHPEGPCAGCAHPTDEPGNEPIPTISFVTLWAGILQAIDLLNEASGQLTSGQYTICNPYGLSGTRPIISGTLAPVTYCPVQCSASQRLSAAHAGRSQP